MNVERRALKGAKREKKSPPGEAVAPRQRGRVVSEAATEGNWLLRSAVAGLLIAVAISALAAAGVPRLTTDANVDLLVDPSSAQYKDEQLYASTFGSDPIVVEVEAAPGQQLLTPQHMVGLAGMEGKLAGIHGVKRVYGPGTLVNTFATEVTKRALDICGRQGQAAEQKAINDARAAGKSPQDQQNAGQAAFDAAVKACAGSLAAQYPSLGLPAVDNPAFYGEVLLEPGGRQVRPFWVWALPDTSHALIQVRMDPSASPADVRTVVDRIDSQSHRAELAGTRTHVTGAPALAVSLADSVQHSLLILLPLTLLAMLLVSLLAIRVPLRLLAVPLAALAGLWTAGIAAWVRLPLTPATLAVLPVVLGLTTDYVIQAVNRLAEETGDAETRLLRVAGVILPATGVAALATAAAVLAFAASPIPLVRQFALFMALGVACSFAVSVLAGLPLVYVIASRRPTWAATSPARVWPVVERAGRSSLGLALALAVLGLAGWAAMPFVKVETDISQLMPAGSQALAEADHVRHAVGLVGELDLVLKGDDVTSPAAVAWLQKATDQATGGDLRPLTGLSTFLTAFNNGAPPDAQQTETILARIPSYFTGAVVSSNKKLARSVFGVPRLTSVADDQALIARLTGAAGSPPEGYKAYPAGLAVIAAQALQSLEHEQLLLNLGALAVVLIILLVAYRQPLTALLAVLPTAVAAGWATGLLALLRFESSPINVLLAGVVVAFATEFSVLWLARYREEMRWEADPMAASAVASQRVGPAIVASALALAAGFGVLVVSPVPMVRDFGLACGLDIVLATAAVLTLLPPMARAWLQAPA